MSRKCSSVETLSFNSITSRITTPRFTKLSGLVGLSHGFNYPPHFFFRCSRNIETIATELTAVSNSSTGIIAGIFSLPLYFFPCIEAMAVELITMAIELMTVIINNTGIIAGIFLYLWN